MLKKLVFVLLLITYTYAEEKINIAIMNLDGNSLTQADLIALTDRLRIEFFNTNQFNVIERSRVDEILKEQGFTQTGCTNTECAVEIGQLIGVQKMILGSVNRIGDIYTVNIRMVDVQTGKIEVVAAQDCNKCEIGEILTSTLGIVVSKIVSREQSSVPETVGKINTTVWKDLDLGENAWAKYKKSGLEISVWNKKRKRNSVILLATGYSLLTVTTILVIWEDPIDMLPVWVIGLPVSLSTIIPGHIVLSKARRVNNHLNANSCTDLYNIMYSIDF